DSSLSIRIFVRDKMSRDVITVGSTMCIPLLYREQMDREAMINSIQNGDQPLPVIDQVSLAGNAQNAPPTLKDLNNKTAKDLWDALERKDNYELNYKFLNNLQPEWKQYGTLMRQTKNLMDINIDALYNILKQNQGDVNDALGYKKKVVVVTSDLLALVAKKTNISALLAKAFNRRKFYSKPTNNNLRTSSTSQSANKKQEFVKTDDKKVEKKANEKKRDLSKVKCYNCKKEGHFAKDCKKAKKDSDEQVLPAEDQAWMESSSDSDKKINPNMVFMAQIEKTIHMIMPYKDNLYNGRKGIGFENLSYFEKAKYLRPTLYDEKVIGLGYVNEKINFEDDYFQEIINLDFEKIDSSFQQTSSLKPYVPNVILEKIIIDLEGEVVSLLEKEKENLKTIDSLKSNCFESSENAISESENQSESYCLEIKKECDEVENPKVIALGMFNLRVSQSFHQFQ
nr:hypothetical protein [Tanacetum cinerariifolium]